MTYPSLTENGTQGLLHQAVAKLEACGARVTMTQQGMVAIDVNQGATTRARGRGREQLHAEPITQESAEMAPVEGLLQARDPDCQEPIAGARKLEALEEGAQARGVGRGKSVR